MSGPYEYDENGNITWPDADSAENKEASSWKVRALTAEAENERLKAAEESLKGHLRVERTGRVNAEADLAAAKSSRDSWKGAHNVLQMKCDAAKKAHERDLAAAKETIEGRNKTVSALYRQRREAQAERDEARKVVEALTSDEAVEAAHVAIFNHSYETDQDNRAEARFALNAALAVARQVAGTETGEEWHYTEEKATASPTKQCLKDCDCRYIGHCDMAEDEGATAPAYESAAFTPDEGGEAVVPFCRECANAGSRQTVKHRFGAWICPVHSDRGHVSFILLSHLAGGDQPEAIHPESPALVVLGEEEGRVIDRRAWERKRTTGDDIEDARFNVHGSTVDAEGGSGRHEAVLYLRSDGIEARIGHVELVVKGPHVALMRSHPPYPIQKWTVLWEGDLNDFKLPTADSLGGTEGEAPSEETSVAARPGSPKADDAMTESKRHGGSPKATEPREHKWSHTMTPSLEVECDDCGAPVSHYCTRHARPQDGPCESRKLKAAATEAGEAQ